MIEVSGGADKVAAEPSAVPNPSDTADTAAGDREAKLLVVGAAVDDAACERALFALAADTRHAGTNYVADFGAFLLTYAGTSEAQLFQDLFALFVAEPDVPGFFVEIGTGDGRLISNTYLLETAHRWTGVVVEPNPVFLPALRANRSCAIACDCVLDITGREVTFRCTADPEFSFVGGIAAPAHLEASAAPVAEVTLATTSLNDLLVREGCPRTIDYISIDVEGAEYEILQTFDFNGWDVRCFTVEHNHTSSRDQIYLLLTAHGYVRVLEHFSQWDDWYVHRSVLERSPAGRPLLATVVEKEAPEVQPHQYVQWALEAIGRGEPAAAEALCDRAIVLNPSYAPAFRTLADIAVGDGRRSTALERWREAVAADPSDYWSRYGLAEALAGRGLLSEAAAHLDVAVGLDPDGPATALRQTLAPKLAALRP